MKSTVVFSLWIRRLTCNPELMSFTELNGRQWDDETQKYLVNFFHAVESEPSFQSLYHSLTDNEREKLQRMDQH